MKLFSVFKVKVCWECKRFGYGWTIRFRKTNECKPSSYCMHIHEEDRQKIRNTNIKKK